ncbi:capsule biosynthesis protein [Pseudogemmobacter sp. CC-YST710]|uniref:Capsule biosynthesis protein n=2 Tax=Pseudogemmobacter faecipullorum TaxID=2755041 RepID=A0ABS8CIY6_9RHOB|nr:capsule biosynthesis protein [Pseudogemmobacter faecipullorum]
MRIERRAKTGTAAAAAAAPAAASAEPLLFDNDEDGFGPEGFATAGQSSQTSPAAAPAPPAEAAASPDTPARDPGQIAAALEAIRAEGLTGRQLRNARRVAQRHEISAASDIDAVRLLRQAGIDPFQRGAMLDMVEPEESSATGASGAARPDPAASPEGQSRALTALNGEPQRLPQPIRPGAATPSPEARAEVNHAAEIRRMQQDIARRRRRKLSLLFMRLFMFVLLPTLFTGWYFASVATRQYGTKSEFAVQMAESPMAAGGMGGLLQGTSMATSQDSIAVQGYLQSREAMQRLEADVGFRRYFTGDNIDPVLRLAPDAAFDAGYKLYRSHLKISYDPSEGIIRMEVIAPDPEISVKWSEQLISYAEGQVDQLTQRLRADAMRGARESYVEAEAAVVAAQERVVALQERFKILSSEAELSLLTQQISALDTQLIQEKLALAQMEGNATPNPARIEPVRRRITILENEISLLRKRLTEGEDGSTSLAQIQGQLLVAQADVETRQMILAQSLQAMENSRIEANRQTRYLSTSVSPIAPDLPSYPKVFENTLVTMLILLGIYLMISMTVAILREQVSS